MHWGQVVDTNAFGTHEFLDLCELLGAEPYIAGNVGSGTPEEMRDWIEYMTYDGDSELANLRRKNGRDKPWKIKYFGVGNENWGCGGNMRPEYYADLFRRYATFCRDFGDNQLVRVACGPGGLNQELDPRRDGPRRATRCRPTRSTSTPSGPSGSDKTPATGFGEEEWFAMLRECLNIETGDRRDRRSHGSRRPATSGSSCTSTNGAPGTASKQGHPGYGLYQQNSLRDAVLAGLTFHIFHEHNDRVKMANIAQMVNVLQAMILTDEDSMLLTPTYHVFEMYKVHQTRRGCPCGSSRPTTSSTAKKMPALSVSASRDEEGVVHVSIVNAHATAPVELRLRRSEASKASKVAGRILTADKLDAHNTFDDPNAVKPATFDGAKLDGEKLTAEIPPHSVVVLTLEK